MQRLFVGFGCGLLMFAISGFASAADEKQKPAPAQKPTQKKAVQKKVKPTQKPAQKPTQKKAKKPTQKPTQKGGKSARVLNRVRGRLVAYRR